MAKPDFERAQTTCRCLAWSLAEKSQIGQKRAPATVCFAAEWFATHNLAMAKKMDRPGFRGRLERSRRTSRFLVTLMLVSASAIAAPVGDAAAHTPVAVTTAFYNWYVMKFRSDHDPMLELRAGARGLVSTSLLDEVDAPTGDGTLDFDYFLQVEDVVRPCRSLDAALLGTEAGNSEVAVTLGSRTRAPWRLLVGLVKADGVWRIRRIMRDSAHPPAAAAKRALSDC